MAQIRALDSRDLTVAVTEVKIYSLSTHLSNIRHRIFVLRGFIVDLLLHRRARSDVHYVRGAFVCHSVADTVLRLQTPCHAEISVD